MPTEAISTESLHALAHAPVEDYRGYVGANVRRGHCVQYVTPQGETHAACVEQVVDQQRGLVTLLTVLMETTLLDPAGRSVALLSQVDRVPFSATPAPHTWHYWI